MIDTAYRTVEVEEVEPGWLVDLGDEGVLVVARVLKLAEGVELYGATTRQPSRKRTVVFKRHETVTVFADAETLDRLEVAVVDGLREVANTLTVRAERVEVATTDGVWTIPLRPAGSNWHGPKPTADAADEED
jgi:hypothetical protein